MSFLRLSIDYVLFVLPADLADEPAFPAGNVVFFLEGECPFATTAVFFPDAFAPAAFPFAAAFPFGFGAAAAFLP